MRRFLTGHDELPREVWEDNSSQIYQQLIDNEQFSFLGQFRLSKKMMADIINTSGVDSAIMVIANPNNNYRNQSSFAALIYYMIDNHQTLNMEEFIGRFVDEYGADKMHSKILMESLNEEGFAHITDRILQDLSNKPSIQRSVAEYYASQGALDNMVSAAIKGEFPNDSGLINLAVTAYIAGHEGIAEEFIDRFNLDESSYANQIFTKVIEDRNVERAHDFLARYVTFDAATIESIFTNSDDDRMFKYELAEKVGASLSPDLQDVLSNMFSGTLDDNLRATWAKAASAQVEPVQQPATSATVPTVSLPSP